MTTSDVSQRNLERQTRLLPIPLLAQERTPRDLFQGFRRHLIRAVNDGRLTDSVADVHKHLRHNVTAAGFTIYGARHEQTNFRRDRNAPHFTRDDGAWFDFQLSGRASPTGLLEILAYSCEIRLPEAVPALPRFVRFDLNLPDHHNEEPGLRCHLHPGHDDLQVPAPFLNPLEIVDLCVYGLTWPAKLRS